LNRCINDFTRAAPPRFLRISSLTLYSPPWLNYLSV
jgi:hypothetical protein